MSHRGVRIQPPLLQLSLLPCRYITHVHIVHYYVCMCGGGGGGGGVCHMTLGRLHLRSFTRESVNVEELSNQDTVCFSH